MTAVFCVRCLPNDWDDLHLDKRPAAFCGGPTWVIQPGTVRPGRTDCVKRDCKVHHRYKHNTLSLWHQHFCCKYLEIYSIQLFTCLGSIRFLKEASYALQWCIYLISNTIVKYYNNLNVFYLKLEFLPLMKSWIFSIITPVLSVILRRSFRK